MLSKHLIHRSKNRSQVSLETPAEKGSYGDSPLSSPGFPPQSAPSSSSLYDEEEQEPQRDPLYESAYQSEEARYYQAAGPHPKRSQSTRSRPLISTNQPTINLVSPHSSASTPSSAIEEDPDRYYQQQLPVPQVQRTEPQKKKRGFFGLGSSSTKDSGKNAPQKLGRSISVRRKEEPQAPHYSDIRDREHLQQRRQPSGVPLAGERHEPEDSEAVLRSSQNFYNLGGPPLPDKDPLRSPAFPPPLTHEEYLYGKANQKGQTNSSRYPLERQGSYQTPWEKTIQQINQHSRTESIQPTPSSYHPSPSSATSASSHPFAQKTPHENIQPYRTENSRPPSRQSLEASLSRDSEVGDYQSRTESTPAISSGYPQGSMGPPPSQQPPPNRRSSESTQQSQTSQGRESNIYHPYNQGVQQGSALPSNGPPPQYTAQLAPQGQNFRNNSQTSPMAQHAPRDSDGRTTPPPSRSRDDLSNLDVAQLLQRHDELRMNEFLFRMPSTHFVSTYAKISYHNRR